ncbi:MAG: Xylose import ATP-binding protein XylG [Elusimicrobia bacterium ADurb.Bin231]|nr:MAG: Xylose import ATP-binding protein XylG [Elusimicrobia bacterium ADurb.Bin231]
MADTVIELRNIVKRFGKVVANNGVNLSVRKGEIHAIVGENGAGKSTLMKILYGLYHPDCGEIILNGCKISRNTPQNAIKNGIGMVHQHFMLIPPLTVTENVILGIEPAKKGILDLAFAAKEIQSLSDKFNLKIDPSKKIEELSVGENQRVEIIKVLYRGAEILILDEPTAVLTPQEVKEFFGVIKNLVSQGKTVIIITHKLDEVMDISDRITVMKQGRTINTLDTAKTSPREIARIMVGRDVLLKVDKKPMETGNTILSVENLSVMKNASVHALKEISFQIKAGEILGIAGVEGNGQTELIEAIMGLNIEKIVSGKVSLMDMEMSKKSTKYRLKSGFSHIPEDRHKRGLVLEFSVRDNLILGRHNDFSASGFLQEKSINSYSETLINDFDIRPPDADVAAEGLSGGNQQKIIVAREFSRNFEFLLAAQPTRGVDIGAIEFIHRRIIAARDEGKAVLLVSAELSEILSLSDTIAVLYKGRIAKIFNASSTNENELGAFMTGAAS